MKFQIVLLGGLLCLGVSAPAQTKSTTESGSAQTSKSSTQSANRMKRPAANGEQSYSGCVDQQDGKYVLLDENLRRYISLQTPGTDADSMFARYLGHKVQVSGTPAGEANSVKVAHINGLSSMCGTRQ